MDKASLFAALEAEVKEIEVAALGIALKFRVLTGRARDEFQKAFAEGDKSASHFEASIVAATVVDDAGQPMFTAEDIATLRDKSAAALGEVAKVAMTVNKMGVDAEKAAAGN
jgi:hypothetical protein